MIQKMISFDDVIKITSSYIINCDVINLNNSHEILRYPFEILVPDNKSIVKSEKHNAFTEEINYVQMMIKECNQLI